MDILTGENESLILLANIDFRYWSVVHPVRVAGMDGGISLF